MRMEPRLKIRCCFDDRSDISQATGALRISDLTGTDAFLHPLADLPRRVCPPFCKVHQLAPVKAEAIADRRLRRRVLLKDGHAELPTSKGLRPAEINRGATGISAKLER